MKYVPPKTDQHRALSFGASAELYDRVRPTYPLQVVSEIFAGLPVRSTKHRVVDVGAGTGKLTAVLVAARLDVDAVEPDPEMRTVFASRLPEVRVHAGRGEELPLPGTSVDAVLYGQAWHWVDDVRGADEAARVLRPGGLLAMLWNYETGHTVWGDALERLADVQSRDDLPPPPALRGFTAAAITRVPWSRSQIVAEVPDYALSHSAVAVLPEQQRDAVLTAVRRAVDEHLSGHDQVMVPMQVTCWTYRKLD